MIKVIITVVVVFASLIVATPQAQAAERCVTRSELSRTDRGMTQARVHRLYDTRGRHWSRFKNTKQRRYRGCGNIGRVQIIYVKRNGAWRVSNVITRFGH